MPEVVLLLTLKGNLKEMITIIIVIRVKQSLEKWYIYLKKKKKNSFSLKRLDWLVQVTLQKPLLYILLHVVITREGEF